MWSAEGERVRVMKGAESRRKRSKLDRKTKISHPPRVLLDFLPLDTVPTDSCWSHDAGHMIPAHKPSVCFNFIAKRKK